MGLVAPHHRPPTRNSDQRVYPRMDVATAVGSRRTWHSQTRMTRQPCACASWVERRSRSALRRIFSAHWPAFGPVQGVLRPCSGHPCQKQPSTKTATLRLGRTKSGVQPLASLRWSRKRPPAAWTAWRRMTSGVVLSLRRPARWAPACVATHFSAIQPTYEVTAVAAASTAVKYFNVTDSHVMCRLTPRNTHRRPWVAV